MNIKNENYIVIHGWQINLGLSGNELLVYAIIYGFSQDGESQFTGSANYIATFINSTRQTVLKVLKTLTEKGFLKKTDRILNNQNFPTYSAVIPNLIGCKDSLQGCKDSLQGGCKDSLHNNELFNKEIIKDKATENFSELNFSEVPFDKWTKQQFKDSIQVAREARAEKKDLPKFGRDMLTAFFAYWSEPDVKGRMRFQMQKTWNTAGRLVTWENRDKK